MILSHRCNSSDHITPQHFPLPFHTEPHIESIEVEPIKFLYIYHIFSFLFCLPTGCRYYDSSSRRLDVSCFDRRFQCRPGTVEPIQCALPYVVTTFVFSWKRQRDIMAGGMIVGIVKTALMTLRRRRGDENLLCGVLKRNSKPNEAVESNLILVPSSIYSPLLSLHVLLLLVEFLLLCLPRDITFYGSSRNSELSLKIAYIEYAN